MNNYEQIDISIAIITYQHEDYIRKTLESVFNQNMRFNFEVVIADDKSTDNTRKILKEFKKRYPDKIKLILQKNNKGPTLNGLSMLKNCSGKYIAFLDGDDFWTDENKVYSQVEFLNNNDEYVASFHDVSIVSDDPKAQRSYRVRKGDINGFESYFSMEPVIPTSSLVTRNIFKQEKIEKYYGQTMYIGDRITHSLLLKYGKIKYINKTMGAYRYIIKKGTSFVAQDKFLRCYDLLKAYHIQYLIVPNKYKENVVSKIKEQRKLVLMECRTIKQFLCIFKDYLLPY